MNLKSKKYYQGLCEINKEYFGGKQPKSKPSSEKDISKPTQTPNQKPTHLLVNFHAKNSVSNNNFSGNHQLLALPRNQSRKNILSKPPKEFVDSNKENREKMTKFPRINKEDCLTAGLGRKRRSKSYKKISTEPYDQSDLQGDEDDVNMKTLSPKESMKQVLMNIVKNKESRHLASIDEQIDKLEILTKRYSGLRKDLVSIQEDILTISFKQKCREKGKESSQFNSAVFI